MPTAERVRAGTLLPTTLPRKDPVTDPRDIARPSQMRLSCVAMTSGFPPLRHELRRLQRVSAPLEEVFDFFADPYNLELITPSWLGFRIQSATDTPVRRGSRIRYRLRLHGVPLRWESVIAEHAEGAMFADQQLAGPYRYWYHRHLFRVIPGGVEIEDIVDYVLPFGALGRLTHALAVRGQLRKIFYYRARRIAERFGSAE